MTSDASRVLELAIEHQAQATLHTKKANLYLTQYTSMVAAASGIVERAPRHSIKCIREWTTWLSQNGPATRQHITEATGVKMTERATPHTIVWEPNLEDDAEAIPPTTLTRFNTVATSGSRGRPPVVYALWSQRFDVKPLFGVGPERHETVNGRDQATEAASARERSKHSWDCDVDPCTCLPMGQPEPLTGVVQPPENDDMPWAVSAWDTAKEIGPVEFNWDGAENWPNGTLDEALADIDPNAPEIIPPIIDEEGEAPQ